MEWLGLSPDEGPFRQSAAEPRHRALADALYDAGYLYACDCTRDVIDERTKSNATPGYDGFCRERNVVRTDKTALRFKIPTTGETVVDDIIRGKVVFPHSAMEDFVAVKSSGSPLFALANMIDDRDMEITHIIRGEDLLPTTPKQLLMWDALNHVDRPLEVPQFAHLPMLVNEQRKKLSKRKDPVAVESYRDQGYLPDAFVNYLALLGWSPKGDQEIVDRTVLIDQFRLDEVHHAPAFFDVAKMTHINAEYIRALSPEAFVESVRPWVQPEKATWSPEGYEAPWSPERFREDLFLDLAPLIQERITVLSEVPSMVDFLFLEQPVFDEAALTKVIVNDERARAILEKASDVFASCDFTAETLHAETLAFGEALGFKLRITQAPVRVAVTGRSVGPPLFESLVALGRDEVLRRLAHALMLAKG